MPVDFEKIWAQNGSVTAPSDTNYLEGFAHLGSAPPTEELFNFLQQNNDLKMKDLNDRMPDGGDFLPLAGITSMTGPFNEAIGANIASSATINLTTATGNFVHITGTTTITAVTLGVGMRRHVIFDGVLTLTHHATNNNLPGGANITTAAGDRATYWSDGTTVYCTEYTKANGTAVVVPVSVTAASQEEVNAGIVNDKYVAPSTLAGSMLVVRAACTFNGSAGTIIAQYNVAGITKNGIGDWTFTFTTDMPDTNYTVAAIALGGDVTRQFSLSTSSPGKTTHQFRLRCFNYNSSAADETMMNFVVFSLT